MLEYVSVVCVCVSLCELRLAYVFFSLFMCRERLRSAIFSDCDRFFFAAAATLSV